MMQKGEVMLVKRKRDKIIQREPKINNHKNASGSAVLLGMSAVRLLTQDGENCLIVQILKNGNFILKPIKCFTTVEMHVVNTGAPRINSLKLKNALPEGKLECRWNDVEEGLEVIGLDTNKPKG